MKRVIAFAMLLSCFAAVSAAPKKDIEKKDLSIAVFVPGIVSGSPVYEMLTSGVQRAVAEKAAAGSKVTVKIIEAGTQQSEWANKLTSLVAEGAYDLFISSNPAMPDIIDPISKQFPGTQFMVFDSWYAGNPNITTFRYNQREQAYISGYMSALVSSSSMKYSNPDKKIGLIAGQEYPAMNKIILPAFIEGAKR